MIPHRPTPNASSMVIVNSSSITSANASSSPIHQRHRGPERHFSLPLDQLSETRIPSEVGPHHQRVDEEADQPLNLSPRPVRDRRPDADVLLPAVPHQERLEGRHQRHEHRRPFPPTEIPQALAQLFTELYLLLPTSIARRGG